LNIACPSVQATDPCSTSNPNYQTTCGQCQTTALNTGSCAQAYQACLNNTP
jgi:hypothetical protein